MSTEAERPTARPDLELEEAADGYVVFDEDADRVHYLNHTAALVLELCNGSNSTDVIVGLLQRAYELPEPPERETLDCLDQLRDQGLVRAIGE